MLIPVNQGDVNYLERVEYDFNRIQSMTLTITLLIFFFASMNNDNTAFSQNNTELQHNTGCAAVKGG